MSFYKLTSKENHLSHSISSSAPSASKTSEEEQKGAYFKESKSGSELDSQEKNTHEYDKSKQTDDFESVYLQANTSESKTSFSSNSTADDNSFNRIVNLPPKSMADLLNQNNDFQAVSNNQSPTPTIAYWFGLCKFVVLTPTRTNNFIDSESRAKVILSSISVAINNTGRYLFKLFNPNWIKLY